MSSKIAPRTATIRSRRVEPDRPARSMSANHTAPRPARGSNQFSSCSTHHLHHACHAARYVTRVFCVGCRISHATSVVCTCSLCLSISSPRSPSVSGTTGGGSQNCGRGFAITSPAAFRRRYSCCRAPASVCPGSRTPAHFVTITHTPTNPTPEHEQNAHTPAGPPSPA